MLISTTDERLFLEKGYWVVPNNNNDYLEALHNRVHGFIAKKFPETTDLPLSDIHTVINKSEVNDIRMAIFNELNSNPKFRLEYFSLGKQYIEHLCGTELAANAKVNFSIQLPMDDTSILPSHCDTFSGESSYQINLWVPITPCSDNNSMHIFTAEATDKIVSKMDQLEMDGLDAIFERFSINEDYEKLTVNFGEIVVFTPTMLHGNSLNTTNKTRISFNCRFKNLHSPYNAPQGSSKILGQFYSPLTELLATKIGRERALDIIAKRV